MKQAMILPLDPTPPTLSPEDPRKLPSRGILQLSSTTHPLPTPLAIKTDKIVPSAHTPARSSCRNCTGCAHVQRANRSKMYLSTPLRAIPAYSHWGSAYGSWARFQRECHVSSKWERWDACRHCQVRHERVSEFVKMRTRTTDWRESWSV